MNFPNLDSPRLDRVYGQQCRPTRVNEPRRNTICPQPPETDRPYDAVHEHCCVLQSPPPKHYVLLHVN